MGRHLAEELDGRLASSYRGEVYRWWGESSLPFFSPTPLLEQFFIVYSLGRERSCLQRRVPRISWPSRNVPGRNPFCSSLSSIPPLRTSSAAQQDPHPAPPRTQVQQRRFCSSCRQLPRARSFRHPWPLSTLAGPNRNRLRVLVTSKTTVQGSACVGDALQRLLAPRRGQKVVVKHASSVPTSVSVWLCTLLRPHIKNLKAVEIVFGATT